MVGVLVADIHPLTYELRLGILQAKEEKLSARISPNILEFLAHKITSNVRELEGALKQVSSFLIFSWKRNKFGYGSRSIERFIKIISEKS